MSVVGRPAVQQRRPRAEIISLVGSPPGPSSSSSGSSSAAAAAAASAAGSPSSLQQAGRSAAAGAAAAATAATTSASASAASSAAEQQRASSSSNGAGGVVATAEAASRRPTGQQIEEAAMRRCIDLQLRHPDGLPLPPNGWSGPLLEQAYARCGEVTSEYAKTFYLGTQLMTPKQARAIWAIYVWCRRTDELVDGPNAGRITPQALDRWEERLEAIFEGRPYDMLDAALTDTIAQFPVDIQPFRDMVDGMRMDLVKSRYRTYDELYEYCYKVAGTVALMSVPVMGVDPGYTGPLDAVYRSALALGTANQLTNILRDVGEDVASRNRIYLPSDELDAFGISERDVVNGLHAPTTGKMDDRWRRFMAFQISRARQVFADAEAGVNLLQSNARWPVWSALILYRGILDAIEANDYDNFTRRAYVPKWRKFASLPAAFARAALPAVPAAQRQAAVQAGVIMPAEAARAAQQQQQQQQQARQRVR